MQGLRHVLHTCQKTCVPQSVGIPSQCRRVLHHLKIPQKLMRPGHPAERRLWLVHMLSADGRLTVHAFRLAPNSIAEHGICQWHARATEEGCLGCHHCCAPGGSVMFPCQLQLHAGSPCKAPHYGQKFIVRNWDHTTVHASLVPYSMLYTPACVFASLLMVYRTPSLKASSSEAVAERALARLPSPELLSTIPRRLRQASGRTRIPELLWYCRSYADSENRPPLPCSLPGPAVPLPSGTHAGRPSAGSGVTRFVSELVQRLPAEGSTHAPHYFGIWRLAGVSSKRGCSILSKHVPHAP